MTNKYIKIMFLFLTLILLLISVVNATEVSDDTNTHKIEYKKVVSTEKTVTKTCNHNVTKEQKKTKVNKNKEINKTKKENNTTNLKNNSKKKTTLSLFLDNNKAGYADKVKIFGYLKDNKGNPISNETINLNVDSFKYNAQTDTNGYFSKNYYVYDISLKNFTDMYFKINASFKGNEYYYSSMNNTKFLLTTYETVIKIVHDKTSYDLGESIIIKGSLRVKHNGWGIANQTIEIIWRVDNPEYPDYVNYYVKTDKNGAFTCNITPKYENNYWCAVKFNGTKKYYETITPENFFIVSNDTNVFIDLYPFNSSTGGIGKNDNLICIGRIFDEYNNNITDITITNVIIKGHPTNNSTFKGFTLKYTVKPYYSGDSNEFMIIVPKNKFASNHKISHYTVGLTNSYYHYGYNITAKTKDFYIKQKTDLTVNNISTIRQHGKVLITGKVTRNNKPIKNGLIKLNIGGFLASTKVIDGTYSYTYTANNVDLYDVTVVYCGDSINGPTSVKTTFNVTDKNITLPTNISLPTLKQKTYKENITITGKLKDANGIIIKNATIKVKINTKTYTTKTNSKGVYTVRIVANKVGTNNVTVTYTGNNYYKSVTKKTTFKTVARATKLTVNKISTTTKGKTVKITGKLTDNLGTLIKTGKVKIKINTKTMTVKTNNKGIYTFNYKTTTKGIKNITVTYQATTNYKKSSIKTSFKVK
ncbi:hypothetical protein PXD04_06945 [Methanosphaera sp. ISO3-F5]|uniref:hypothetical protein n=1 Tax=Methanosphaera sp. ISO3-F5 TaxID=1452353 RepID=UPI002B25D454|nr:hypothetical protein [Methanosphaera sp. ISO3-F5]WQH63440.1 hypothetical protein PXD04_06945 [Methanosphaera sp. ISO3-F5]